jgi:tight adherence protein B
VIRWRRVRRLAAAALVTASATVLAGAASLGASVGTSAPASAASATAAATPSPALSQPVGRIVQLSSTTGKLEVLFSALGLSGTESIDPASVQVTINGTPIPAQGTPVGATPPPTITRAAVIVIDISGSMKGAGIAGAKQAADAFLAAVPADVQVGLITVSTKAKLVAAPSTNRAVVRADIAALQAIGNTALYDGTVLALQTVSYADSRTVVLLTDGHDDGSTTTLAQAVSAARAAGGTVLDAVSFGTAAAQVAPLQQLTATTGGRLIATTQAGDFAPAFQHAAQDISTQVLVNATVPVRYAGSSATIQVSAKAGGFTISDSAYFPLAALPPVVLASPTQSPPAASFGPHPVAIAPTHLSSKRTLDIGLAAIFVALVMLFGSAAWRLSTTDARDTRVRRRLSFYTLTGRPTRKEQPTTALGDTSVARSAVDLAGRLVVSRNFDAKLGRRLDAAGVPLRAAEWVVIEAACSIGFGILFALLGGGSVVAGVLGFVIGFGAPIGYLIIKESRRSRAFLEQLPDTLQLIAGSLSVGHSLSQAMDAVVKEDLIPISVEFNRALIETRLGMPVEDALDGIGVRMASTDFSWIVMAIRIQREVGGNLAEILTTVAATIRDRERIRRQVQGLSAEGRLSAWILGVLPPLLGTYLILVRPSYVKPLFTDPIGISLLVLMVVLMVAGVFWLSRLVKVEV